MTDGVRDVRGQWPWWSPVLLLGVLAAVFFSVAAIGAAQAARGERVLGWLDPAITYVETAGWQGDLWALAHGWVLGWVIAGTATAIALAGLITGGWRALPLLLIAASVSLAAAGQILILANNLPLGAGLYGLAAISAVALGVWCPLTQLDWIPWFPRRPGSDARPGARPLLALGWRGEWVVIVLLSLTGLLTRMYALTELPQGFELEMVDSILKSRTTWSLSSYISDDFMGNSAGFVHLLPGPMIYGLFGTSVYSVRLSSVLFGFVAIPLVYWLIRRMVGVGGAIVGTVLMIVAPEQLYWSRLETGGFAPIAIVALVSAHVGLWMVQRFSLWALLAVAAWTPIGRFAYAPAYVMVVFPSFLYAHAVVCVRRAWRAAWYAVPILVAGMAMWIFGLSVVLAYFRHRSWQFVHPAFIFGAPVWRMHGEGAFRDASWPDLIRLQAVAMLAKLGEVVAGFWNHEPRMFSQWFLRICPLENHLTVLNAGVAVLFALGLGYLLGQIHLRRAFLLLCWVGLGLLPAILSDEPSTRRLSLMMPAVYVIVAVWLAAVVGIVRTRTRPWLARATALLVSVAVTAIACTSLATHFKVPTGQVGIAPAISLGGQLFKNSDLVLHNLNPALTKGILLGNLDTFVGSPPCYQTVGDKEWLQAVLRLPCDFESYIYKMTMPAERREALRQAYNPRRISFLLEETAYSKPTVELLQQLFPAAEVRRQPFMQQTQTLLSITVGISEVQALRSPSVSVAGQDAEARRRASELLQGVPLTLTEAAAETDGEAPAASAKITVRGGLLLDRNGWYGFQVGPDCPDATISLDGRPSSVSASQPLLAGVHPFELTVPSATACKLPLQLLTQTSDQPGLTPLPASAFVSSRVASLQQAAALPVVPYAGYGEAKVLAQLKGGGMDMGIDAQGRVTVLSMDEGLWRIQRFDRDGREEARWQPQVPSGRYVFGIAVDPEGTVMITAETWVLLYDRTGHQIGAWETAWAATTTDIALTLDGRILLAVPSRDAISVFARDGTLQGEITQVVNGPKLSKPGSVTVDHDGRMLVVQTDGRVLLLRIEGDPLAPVFVREFTADFTILPITARGSAFDGEDRLLIPDPSSPTALVYNMQGERLMATLPDRDLTKKHLGPVIQFRSTADRLYLLESGQVWSIGR